jgi:hypothetical protein
MRLKNLPPSSGDCLQILETVTLRDPLDLNRDWFNFTFNFTINTILSGKISMEFCNSLAQNVLDHL